MFKKSIIPIVELYKLLNLQGDKLSQINNNKANDVMGLSFMSNYLEEMPTCEQASIHTDLQSLQQEG